ncbi:DUF4268 domain-containing protein [Maritimibacter sp. DP1N21-5]|nr:DUF4268 domain-containing protein [Maritimibacter sp. DP1N21-5]
MFEQCEAIEEKAGTELAWDRKDHLTRCLISATNTFDHLNEENWPDAIQWLANSYERIEEAFAGPIGELSPRLKAGEADH